MSRYRRGADFERKVRKWYQMDGWFVIRSAGSKTPVDLVAFKRGEWPRFIQCGPNKTKAALEDLSELASSFGAVAIHWTPLTFNELSGKISP